MSSDARVQELLERNRAWAQGVARDDPGFFHKLSLQQAPRFLWIGCSDSRVPANQITGMAPGEVFVHRNIANVVVHADLNCLSVMQFAVDVLKVEHIIVCGHYGCGGVHAALTDTRIGLADNWLRHVGDVALKHRDRLAACTDEAQRHDRLCALNVIEQTLNVCQTTVVRDAWARAQTLAVHGWIYGLRDGRLQPLTTGIDALAAMPEAERAALAGIG